MSTTWFATKKLNFDAVTDGRLEKEGAFVFPHKDEDADSKCLTDGIDFVWIYRSDDVGAGFITYGITNPWCIFGAIHRVFDVQFESEHEIYFDDTTGEDEDDQLPVTPGESEEAHPPETSKSTEKKAVEPPDENEKFEFLQESINRYRARPKDQALVLAKACLVNVAKCDLSEPLKQTLLDDLNRLLNSLGNPLRLVEAG